MSLRPRDRKELARLLGTIKSSSSAGLDILKVLEALGQVYNKLESNTQNKVNAYPTLQSPSSPNWDWPCGITQAGIVIFLGT